MKKYLLALTAFLPLFLFAQSWTSEPIKADELKGQKAHTIYRYVINDSIGLGVIPELNEFYIATRGAAFNPGLYINTVLLDTQQPIIKVKIGYYSPDSILIDSEEVSLALSMASRRATIFDKRRLRTSKKPKKPLPTHNLINYILNSEGYVRIIAPTYDTDFDISAPTFPSK